MSTTIMAPLFVMAVFTMCMALTVAGYALAKKLLPATAIWFLSAFLFGSFFVTLSAASQFFAAGGFASFVVVAKYAALALAIGSGAIAAYENYARAANGKTK